MPAKPTFKTDTTKEPTANYCKDCKKQWTTIFKAKYCINCSSQNISTSEPKEVVKQVASKPKLKEKTTHIQPISKPPFLQKVKEVVPQKEEQSSCLPSFGIGKPSYMTEPEPKEKVGGLKLRPKAQPTHTVVDALAGTGKSFVIKEDVYRKLGIKRDVIGSEEQENIWQSTSDLDGQLAPNEIFVGAFNTSIADEMNAALPPGVGRSTWHAFGKRILAMNGVKGARVKYGVRKNKTLYILANRLGCVDTDDLFRKEKTPMIFAIKQFVGFCKLNLIKFTGDWEKDCQIIRLLAYSHGALIPQVDENQEAFFYKMVMDCYHESHKLTDYIDFDDMLFLPWKLQHQIRPFKMVYADERQDMNIAQQDLFYKHMDRSFIAGDVHQAVYGFAGADVKACERLQQRLSPRVRNFPLTYTRRCSQAVVEYAQKFVPEFKYFPGAEKGSVTHDKELTFLDKVQPGHMIVCRTNAPLFTCCLKLFQQKRKFRTTVKDEFEKAVNLVKAFEANDLLQLDLRLQEWRESQLARCRGANEDRGIMIADLYTAIKAGMAMVNNPDELIQLFYDVFGISRQKGEYDKEEKVRKITDDAIYLSSIHLAKGLEAPKVWWLQYDRVPHPKAILLEQERNLQWVASTRAMTDLVLVQATPKKKGEDEWD